MTAEIVNVHAAKTNLSRLLERAEAGEEIVIGRAGKPIARLVPYRADRPKRVFGALKGRIRILPGFDELDAEIERDFENSLTKPLEP
ncbi:MAG: prevent-host-death protein [Chloroflexota bacterium]|jgi:prevent-host-death family protein|nr:prevent-host-death protein [Chloroflexota bacterium]